MNHILGLVRTDSLTFSVKTSTVNKLWECKFVRLLEGLLRVATSLFDQIGELRQCIEKLSVNKYFDLVLSFVLIRLM